MERCWKPDEYFLIVLNQFVMSLIFNQIAWEVTAVANTQNKDPDARERILPQKGQQNK